MSEINSSQALKDFISETEEIIESLSLDLIKLTDSLDSGDCDPEVLNGIFRGAHSIKGLAGMFGFDDLSEISHSMESLLDGLRLGKIPFSQSLIDTLFSALDVLIQLIDGKSKDEKFTIDLNPILTQISLSAQGDVQSEEDPLAGLNIDPAVLNVLTEYEEHRLLENVRKGRRLNLLRMDFDLASFDQELAEITQQLKQHGEVISTLPSTGDIGERIAFQILFGSDLAPIDIKLLLGRDDLDIHVFGDVADGNMNEESASDTPDSFVLGDPEAVGDTEDQVGVAAVVVDTRLPATREGVDHGSSLRSISRTVRVDIDKLDLLMNIVGELVLSKSSIADVTDRLKGTGEKDLVTELGKATRILERRLHELQKGVMDVRMVPVGQLFEKMTRIVRRVANEQDKKIDLDIRGADTELDKLIIEDVSDPLMHIIRNAIDHGLESPQERRAAGKPEKGLIQLWSSQKGNHVVIEVHDDGRGIDTDKVRRKAIEKGLITDTQALTEEDVYDLLFLPGFSTRDEVSDLSGRGVGLDVVKNNIAAMSGMIEIKSVLGQGTSMIITLPITLAIIKALIVRVGETTYAIPINSVLETLMIDADAIQTVEKREVMELRKSTVPLLRLDQLFGLPAAVKDVDYRLYVAIVGLAEKRIGFVVDELLGQQDVVIKSLGKSLAFVKGIAGAAELGNQKTILVLDVAGLMSEALRGEFSF
ncbi:MAG: chemotaxis protein CheA [Desulfuromonadales bacterium]|nr:chemotaxis protein CheA [Desulfuromonadales bacterium]